MIIRLCSVNAVCVWRINEREQVPQQDGVGSGYVSIILLGPGIRERSERYTCGGYIQKCKKQPFIKGRELNAFFITEIRGDKRTISMSDYLV